MSDAEIWKLIVNPSSRRKGFEQLVRQYSEPLYWKVRGMVSCHDDANDILQETFIKAWNNLEKFEGRSSLLTWLYRIAINETFDFLRRNKRASLSDENEASNIASDSSADDFFDGDEAQEKLQKAISQLPPVQRMVFNMRYFDNMKYKDISDVLNTSTGALKASYHLAVKKIMEYFHLGD